MGAMFFVVLVCYFSAVIGIAVWGFRRTSTEVDFLAAGRTIGPIVGGAVLAATQISAGTFVGTLGRHYQTGVSFFYVWLGVWAGWLISAIWVAPRLRAFGALTVPDYIGTRFNSEAARILSAARSSSSAPWPCTRRTCSRTRAPACSSCSPMPRAIL